MTAEVVGVPYEFKKCDLMAGENMKVKKNNHTFVQLSTLLTTQKAGEK